MGHQSNKAIQDWTKDMLEKGFIRLSDSSISVSTFTVLKKDGTHQVVQDYQPVNDITISDQQPIPNI
jgi:hypothetical protein